MSKVENNLIFAGNHTSEIDPLVVPGSLPFFSRFSPVCYLAVENKHFHGNRKFSWRRFFYGGLIFRALGSFPVVPNQGDYEKAMKKHIEIVRNGGVMFVFPEGGITPDGTIQNAHGGVAYLSYVTGRPIVPVKIDGLYGQKARDFCRRRVKAKLTFGEPIYIQSSTPDFKTLANEVMGKIKSM